MRPESQRSRPFPQMWLAPFATPNVGGLEITGAIIERVIIAKDTPMLRLTTGSMFRLVAIAAVALAVANWWPRALPPANDGSVTWYHGIWGTRSSYKITGTDRFGCTFSVKLRGLPGYSPMTRHILTDRHVNVQSFSSLAALMGAKSAGRTCGQVSTSHPMVQPSAASKTALATSNIAVPTAHRHVNMN